MNMIFCVASSISWKRNSSSDTSTTGAAFFLTAARCRWATQGHASMATMSEMTNLLFISMHN